MNKNPNRWLILAQGIIAILFGLAVILWPVKSLVALTWLVGAFFVIEAVILFISSFFSKGSFFHSFIQAIIFGLFGLLILNYPNQTLRIFVFLFAIWGIISGIIQIASTSTFNKDPEFEHMVLFSGIFSLIVGILLLVFPVGTVAISQLILGVTLLVTGISSSIYSFKVK